MTNVLQSVQSTNTNTNTKTLTAPRDGGIDDNGVWTGSGKNGLGIEPVSFNCYRDFNKSSDLRTLKHKQDIQEQCKCNTLDYR